MKAKIVVGLGFGDEGKGITVDFLSKSSPQSTIVVRFSGGQQAGHTVVIGDKRHVYASFGSGTGRGLPTYISNYCTFYPPNIVCEYEVLKEKGLSPTLYINPLAKMTSYWDVAFGRLRERIIKHGSCGIGVGTTMTRNESSPFKLYMVDTLHKSLLGEKLDAVGRYYTEKVEDLRLSRRELREFYNDLTQERIRFQTAMEHPYIRYLVSTGIADYSSLGKFSDFIFEGSQGIMLDMEHGVFPNVTYAHTTSKNALEMCDRMGFSSKDNISLYYVTRCYQTRHGNGWMSPSDKELTLINNTGETNILNEWQGNLRCAELDYDLLRYALSVDNAYSWGYQKNLIVTCLDQRAGFKFDYDKLDDYKFKNIYESRSPDSANYIKFQRTWIAQHALQG